MHTLVHPRIKGQCSRGVHGLSRIITHANYKVEEQVMQRYTWQDEEKHRHVTPRIMVLKSSRELHRQSTCSYTYPIPWGINGKLKKIFWRLGFWEGFLWWLLGFGGEWKKEKGVRRSHRSDNPWWQYRFTSIPLLKTLRRGFIFHGHCFRVLFLFF